MNLLSASVVHSSRHNSVNVFNEKSTTMRLRRHGLVEAEEVGDAAKSRPRAVQTQHANAMVNHQDEAVPAWFTKAMNEHNRLINERFAAFNERLVELSVQLSELDEYASDIEVQQAKLMAMSRQDIRKAKYTPNVRAAIMPKLPPSQFIMKK